MSSSSATESLKESGACSKGTISKQGSATTSKSHEDAHFTSETASFTESSEAILETSPTVSDEHDAGQVEEDYTCCCIAAFNCYKSSAVKLRNSAFMFIVQLVFSSIPVSAFVMGLLFAEKCQKLHFLPVFGATLGIIGAIFMVIWVFATCYNRRGMPISNRQKLLFGFACFVVLVLTIVDAVFVFNLSPSFDPTSSEYCNETFYTFAFYKEVATAVVIVLSTILYLPGSRHILCCHDCTTPSGECPQCPYVSL